MQKSTEKKIPHGCIPDSDRTLPGYEPGVPRTLVHVAICFYLNIIDTYLQSLLSDHFFHICHQGKLCSAAIQIVIFTVNLPAPPNLFPDPISVFYPLLTPDTAAHCTAQPPRCSHLFFPWLQYKAYGEASKSVPLREPHLQIPLERR